jgi:MtrB/PioB family decaheme-associated outer membrane protein
MKTRAPLRMMTIAAGVLAALGSARAEQPEPLAPTGLNTEASAVSLGAGLAANNARRFGEYNGVTESGAYGLVDFNLVRRDEETGTWTALTGRNLALDNRQLRFEQSKQGDWGYYIDYARLPRLEPFTATTAVTGIGSSSLTVPATTTTGGPISLKTTRDRVDLGGEKFLYGNWDVQLNFRNEEKEGARIFGRGTTGSPPAAGTFGVFEFTPEPINSTTHQIDAKLNYTDSALQLSGGYYGTFYNNNQENGLSITGGNPGLGGATPFTPIALPPDNQSHQLYLTGGYNFAQSTRGNFKLAYAKATQNESFIPTTPAPAAGIGDNLMGRLDTTLAQAGVVSSPMSKLTLRGDLRYENRDDKTPVRVFFSGTSPTSTSNGENEPRSIRTTTAKAEGSYALPDGYRVTGGIGWEQKWRNVSAVRVVSARDTTDEISYRLELRRMMSETLTGALAYVHSDRSGSPWLTTVLNDGVTPGSNLIAPITLADRKRDKLRFTANWNPTDPLALTFFVEAAKDDYSHRDGSDIGPEKGSALNFSIDAAYDLTERWQITAWYTKFNTSAEQTTCVGASSAGVCPAAGASPIWRATIKDLSDNFGLGVRGKPVEQVQIGADFSYSNIKDQFGQTALVGNPISSLPDVSTKLARLNAFGRYALDKKSGIRVDYIYDRYSTDDWTWSTFAYADGTTLSESQKQTMNLVAASYYFKF